MSNDKQDAERKWQDLLDGITDSLDNAPDKVVVEEIDPKDVERIRSATLRTIRQWKEIRKGVYHRRGGSSN